MPATYRNQTRTIKNSTESTLSTGSPTATTLAFNLQTTDAFYVGSKQPFTSRYFKLGTVNAVAGTLTVKYWDGSAYTAVTDVIDQTNNFFNDGWISWTNGTNWVAKAQTGCAEELYWIQITVSANMTAGATLQWCGNLFNDSELLRAYYPELITDTRYLPDSRTDFLEQYIAARDLVTRRLKQEHIIQDESQILDIDQVAVAATHATAWIILNPISSQNAEDERAAKAQDEMNKELARVKLSFDYDNSGAIDEVEENTGDVFFVRT